MGYAMEHPLQSVTRQLWAWRDEYGNEAFWNAHIGEQVFAAGEGNAWAFITDEPSVPTPVTA
jgi:acyl-CoA dehydrogenase